MTGTEKEKEIENIEKACEGMTKQQVDDFLAAYRKTKALKESTTSLGKTAREVCGIAGVGKNLLLRLERKEIDMAEFDRECAYWMTQFLSEHAFTPYPAKPHELLMYEEKKRDNFKYEVGEKFWREGEVGIYVRENNEARAKNEGNIHWLNFMKENLPKKDTTNQERVDKVLRTYPGENDYKPRHL